MQWPSWRPTHQVHSFSYTLPLYGGKDMAETQKVYKNKKTGEVVVRKENLDKRQWQFMRYLKQGVYTNARKK